VFSTDWNERLCGARKSARISEENLSMRAENEAAGAQQSAYDSPANARWRWHWRCGAATAAAALVIVGLLGLLWQMGH
jgi:hypothetical protein